MPSRRWTSSPPTRPIAGTASGSRGGQMSRAAARRLHQTCKTSRRRDIRRPVEVYLPGLTGTTPLPREPGATCAWLSSRAGARNRRLPRACAAATPSAVASQRMHSPRALTAQLRTDGLRSGPGASSTTAVGEGSRADCLCSLLFYFCSLGMLPSAGLWCGNRL